MTDKYKSQHEYYKKKKKWIHEKNNKRTQELRRYGVIHERECLREVNKLT